MTSEEVVVAFVTLLGVCVRALASVSVGVNREEPTRPLTMLDAEGRRQRDGEVAGLGTFRLHGAGCRFELDGGEDIDFDWGADGEVLFDSWRLRAFSVSIENGMEEVELRAAARSLTERGVLIEPREGWFSIPATDPRL